MDLKEQRRLAGQCLQCGQPKGNGVHCEKCQAKRNESKKKAYLKSKAVGNCPNCSKPAIKGRTYCEHHLLRYISVSALGSPDFIDELRQLLTKQNFKCGLTGKPITFESDIELDHIIPVSRGGAKDLANVRWVLKIMNRLKGNLLDSEFVELCQYDFAELFRLVVSTYQAKR